MNIGRYELESPLMNAGGLVRTFDQARTMAATGVGAVVAGSFTLEPRIGNAPNGETVYHRDQQTGVTYNCLGMPNVGMAALMDELPDMITVVHDAGKPFILNFAPVTDDPLEEVTHAADYLNWHGITVDAIELNASCPNVKVAGGRHEVLSHHPDRLGEVLEGMATLSSINGDTTSRLVRIAPFAQHGDEIKVVQAIGNNAHAVVGFNTFAGGRPLNGSLPILGALDGYGGMSGSGMEYVVREQTRRLVAARATAGANFDIIGSNGVSDGASMHRRIHGLGASAVGVSTVLYEVPPQRWGQVIDTMLDQYGQLLAAA